MTPLHPIPLQLARLRDIYALHLTRVSTAPMDPVYRQKRVEELQEGIRELEKQIGNSERLHDDIGAYKAQREREEE